MNPYYNLTITCACCGKIKGEPNHWFLVQLLQGFNSFEIWPLIPYYEPHEKHKPVCGDECAHKMLSQFLSSFPRASASPLVRAEASNPAVDALRESKGDQQPEPKKEKVQ